MSRLYLIRHGKPAAVWGEADDDPGLDDAGKAQAEAARDVLMGLNRDNPDALGEFGFKVSDARSGNGGTTPPTP